MEWALSVFEHTAERKSLLEVSGCVTVRLPEGSGRRMRVEGYRSEQSIADIYKFCDTV